MSEMYIRKHGYHTLYCTKHDGKEHICAVEAMDEFNKWYYPNSGLSVGVPLNFDTLVAHSELANICNDGNITWSDVMLKYDNSLPTIVYSIESMLAWIDKNADQLLSAIDMFDEAREDIPRILIDLAHIPARFVRHLLEDNAPSVYAIPPALQPKETRIEEARTHIENNEYLVPVYQLDDVVMYDAYSKVLAHIEKLREGDCTNVLK